MLSQELYTVPSQWKIYYSFALMFSQLMAMIIPLLYWTSRKCRHHPAQIILILCVLEMISTWQFYFQAICLHDFLEWSKASYLISAYSFQENDENQDANICEWNVGSITFSYFGGISYYIVLCIDLIITLQKPFQNSKSRIYIYHICAAINTLIFYLLVKSKIVEYCAKSENRKCQGEFIQLQYSQTMILEIVFFLIASGSLVQGFFHLIRIRNQYSQSARTKQKYIRNHMYMIIGIIIMWLPLTASNIYEQKTNNQQGKEKFWQRLAYLLYLANPILFTIIRLLDPYFYFRVKLFFMMVLGKVTSADQTEVLKIEDLEDENQDEWLVPLNQVVTEKQNKETVCNILRSILGVVQYNNNINFPKSIASIKKLAKIKNISLQKRENFCRTAIIQIEPSELSDSLLSNQECNSLQYKIYEHAPEVDQQLFLIKRYFNTFEQRMEFIKKTFINPLIQNQIRRRLRSPRNHLERVVVSSSSIMTVDQFLKLQPIKNYKYFCIHVLYLLFRFIVLPPYFMHIEQNNQSLINRIYGAYTVEIEGLSAIYLILLENAISQIPKQGQRKYDLKGSLINRYVNNNEQHLPMSQIVPDQLKSKFNEYQAAIPSILKDVNYLESNDIFLELEQDLREQMMECLKNDIELFKQLNIMDYSLLICVNENSKQLSLSQFYRSNGPNSWHRFRKIQTDKKIISLSIIDILQTYDVNKMIERRYKAFFNENHSMISCIDAEQYSQRFYAFINSICVSVHDI